MSFDLAAVGAPIDERYASDMADQSIALMQGTRPDWIPRNASPEVVLIEAMALAAAEVAGQANVAVGTMAELLLSTFYRVPRLPGSPSVGTLTLTFDSPVTTTIPAGSAFVLREWGVEVATTAETVLNAVTTATVQVASAVSTSLVNGATVGAAVDVLDDIPNLLTVDVASTFVGGADPEGDAEYLARASARLNRVTNSLVVPGHFSAYALEDGQAVNALTIPAWDGTGTAPDNGTNAGHVTVVTYGRGGNLPQGVRDTLAARMQAITAAGVTVHVNPANVVTVPVTTTVKAMPGFSAAEVQAAVKAAVVAFLSGESWIIGADMILGQLQDKITSLPQVDYVLGVTEPGANVTVGSDAVVVAGTVTVSVT